MWGLSDDIKQRASVYASRRNLVNEHQLGYGADGTIYSTNAASAVKVYLRKEPYQRELACYLRLREEQVLEVCGHHVPQLVGGDDELLIVEMTIVRRPFVLDFASAYLDFPPDFSDEVIEEWHAEKAEHFGARWPEVLFVMETLRDRYGIHLMDVNPGNITFDETR